MTAAAASPMNIPVSDIARATLHRLTEIGLQPTPDNYAKIFNEIQAKVTGQPLPADPPKPAGGAEMNPQMSMIMDTVRSMLEAVSEKAAHHVADLSAQNREMKETIEHLCAAQERQKVLRLAGNLVTTANSIRSTVEASHDELLETKQALDEIREEIRENRQWLQRDPLTGAQNRRGMDLTLSREVARARRGGTKLSVAMVDIDHFKEVNDRHGHHAGDRLLVHFTEVIRSVLRESDVVVRYGGEEFLLVLPETDVNGCAFVLDRLKHMVQKTPLVNEGKKIAVTFSGGIAQMMPEENAHALIRRADDALLQAKSAGRNCIKLAPEGG